MEAQIPLVILLVGKSVTSVGGMIEIQLFGASDVVGEDTVIVAFLLGEIYIQGLVHIPALPLW